MLDPWLHSPIWDGTTAMYLELLNDGMPHVWRTGATLFVQDFQARDGWRRVHPGQAVLR